MCAGHVCRNRYKITSSVHIRNIIRNINLRLRLKLSNIEKVELRTEGTCEIIRVILL